MTVVVCMNTNAKSKCSGPCQVKRKPLVGLVLICLYLCCKIAAHTHAEQPAVCAQQTGTEYYRLDQYEQSVQELSLDQKKKEESLGIYI